MRHPLAPLLLGLALTAALVPHLIARAEEADEPLTRMRAVTDSRQVLSLAFSPDGTTLATGSADLSAQLRDGRSGELRHTLPTEPRLGAQLRCVRFTPDGKQLVTLVDDQVKVWDVRSHDLLRTVTRESGDGGRLMSLAISPDGKRVAAGGGSLFYLEKYPALRIGDHPGLIWIWDLATGKQQKFLRLADSGEIASLTFSPDGKTLAAGGQNGAIHRWTGDEYTREKPLPTRGGPVLALTFSPDGKLLAGGGANDEVVAWDTQTGDRVRAFSGHRSRVTSLAFSPDGKLLASGSYDQTLKVWNPATGALRQSLPLGGGVHALQFSPDGTRLAAGLNHQEPALRIWDVER